MTFVTDIVICCLIAVKIFLCDAMISILCERVVVMLRTIFFDAESM